MASLRSRCVLLCLLAVLTSCGINPVRIHPPPLGGEKQRTVAIEFTNALNLPAGAKVAFEGDTVGTVGDVRLSSGTVEVLTKLDSDVTIPGDVNAAIVQDTVLGDSYIRLSRPAASGPTAPPLDDGDRIPTSRTAPPASIEDMMTTLSSFLGTGSLQRVQNALQRLNSTMPQSGAETRRTAALLSTNLRSLATHSTEIANTLENLSQLATTLRDRTAYLQDIVSDNSQIYWANLLSAASYIGVLLPSVGSLFTQGYWLIPVLDSAANMFEQAGVAGGPDPVKLGWQIDDLASTTLLPFISSPKLEVTQVVGPDGSNRTADTERILRMLGAIS